jgi:uncharacterized protein (DUF2147 family)
MRKSSLAAVALTCLTSPALAAADPAGDWMVADKVAVIRVAPCGQALCGHIVWTKGPAEPDRHNPDPAKRSQSTLGLKTVIDMKPTRSNRWEGEIYNAQDGKTYQGSISLVSEYVLRIEGCVLGFLCGGQNWTRAKCTDPSPATAKASGRKTNATSSTQSPTFPSLCREAAP